MVGTGRPLWPTSAFATSLLRPKPERHRRQRVAMFDI